MKKASSSRTSRQIKAWGKNAVLCAGTLDLRKYKQDWNFLRKVREERLVSFCEEIRQIFVSKNRYYIPLLVDVLGLPK